MRDFAYAVGQIPGLFLYYKGDGSPFGSMTDYGPNGITATMHGFVGNTGQPACGYLLDQHVPTSSMSFQGGHGHVTYSQSNLTTAEAALLNNQSWSFVIAGMKPHDMSVARTWFGVGNSDIGMRLIINTDGSLRVSGGAGTSATSTPSVIRRFVPHLIIVSYDNATGRVSVHVGDWTGRWVLAINAAAISPVTALANGSGLYLGTAGGAGPTADGFLDDLAVYAGHAVTSLEADALLQQAGYTSGLSYSTTVGHRNAPLNQAFPDTQTLDANSTAAASAIAGDVARATGGGGFDYYQFTTAYYTVSKAFRQNSANWQTITGPGNYGDQSQFMEFEDVPLPYGGRPSLGFQPSAGSDAHLTIYCSETDEIWDMGVLTNSGTDAAPVWSCNYGGKVTQASLLMTSFQSSYLGATATGIPSIMGCPTISELVAAQSGTPIPHGLAYVCYDAAIAHVWPAQRHDGSITSAIIEGQVYRLKHDAATNSAINAMVHPTGKAIARAIQTYGMLIVDKNVFAGLLHTEDQYQFLTVNGYNAYGQDALGNTANGILNGQQFSVNTMSGFPWANMELLSSPALNPADVTQAIRAAPTNLTGQQFSDRSTISWADDARASYWNVYQNVNGTYNLISQSYWPTYTVWSPTSMTLAVTAVNGGGESSRSVDVVPQGTSSGPLLGGSSGSSFVPKAWQDSPNATTPLSAAALIDLETRLSAYTDQFGSALSTVAADGTTDDAPAIQAAINALPSGGGMIRLPPGTIMLGTGLTFPQPTPSSGIYENPILLRGSGPGATILKKKNDVILIDDSGSVSVGIVTMRRGVNLQDLTLDGGNLGSQPLMRCYYALDSRFVNVNFQNNNNGSAVVAIQFWDSYFVNTWFTNCGGTVPTIDQAWNGGTSQNGNECLRILSAQQFPQVGNSTMGYSTDNCNNVWFVNTNFTFPRVGGVYVGQVDPGNAAPHRLYFVNTKFEDNAMRGPFIRMYGAHYVNFHNTNFNAVNVGAGVTSVDLVHLANVTSLEFSGQTYVQANGTYCVSRWLSMFGGSDDVNVDGALIDTLTTGGAGVAPFNVTGRTTSGSNGYASDVDFNGTNTHFRIRVSPNLTLKNLPADAVIEGSTHQVTLTSAATNSTTTMSATGLTFPIGANETWVGEFFLSIIGSTAGMNFDVDGPAAATRVEVGWQGNTASTSAFASERQTAFDVATATAYASGGITGQVRASLVVQNGTNSGNVTLRFKAASAVQTNTINAGSYFNARRLG